MSGVRLGGRESDLTIPECGLARPSCARRVGVGGAMWPSPTAAPPGGHLAESNLAMVTIADELRGRE